MAICRAEPLWSVAPSFAVPRRGWQNHPGKPRMKRSVRRVSIVRDSAAPGAGSASRRVSIRQNERIRRSVVRGGSAPDGRSAAVATGRQARKLRRRRIRQSSTLIVHDWHKAVPPLYLRSEPPRSNRGPGRSQPGQDLRPVAGADDEKHRRISDRLHGRVDTDLDLHCLDLLANWLKS
jgi:hypothetical protein